MINANFFTSRPVHYKNKCTIYPVKISEIIENENFNIYKSLLTISQEELEDEFINEVDFKGDPIKIPTPLEYLLSQSYKEKKFEFLAKQAFQFFLKEPVTFIYDTKQIVIGDLKTILPKLKNIDSLRIIGEEEYFDFQNKIRESLGEKPIEPPNPDEDPRVKRIKAKARYREKIKAKQNLGLNFGDSLAIICCMDLGITPLNIGELSYVAFKVLMEYYQEKEKYDIDIRSLLAGGDSKKIKPKYWVRNLE